MDTQQTENAVANDGRPWPPRMAAWQLTESYGTFEDLTLNAGVDSPASVGPKELLVRVKASSVNPIDVLMAGE